MKGVHIYQSERFFNSELRIKNAEWGARLCRGRHAKCVFLLRGRLMAEMPHFFALCTFLSNYSIIDTFLYYA